jgi:hypothetical protein
LFAVCHSTKDEATLQAWLKYDRALRSFEKRDLEAAADTLAAVDDSIIDVPWRFLRERVQNELGGRRRRRSTDKAASDAGGVVILDAK